jgi:excisionase family DNA binding protein
VSTKTEISEGNELIAKIPASLTRQDQDNEVLTSNEVAELLKVHLSSVRRWSRSGKLRGYRLGGSGEWRFLRKDVLSFLYSYSTISEGGGAIEE